MKTSGLLGIPNEMFSGGEGGGAMWSEVGKRKRGYLAMG